MLKKIIILCILIVELVHVQAQKHEYILGFNNGENAILKIEQGNIFGDNFNLSLNVTWTNKKGQPEASKDRALYFSKPNIQISPSNSVRCFDIQSKDLYVQGAETLHFELLPSYTGQSIIIILSPEYIEERTLKTVSPIEFSLPESIEIKYEGNKNKPVFITSAEQPDLIIKNEKFNDADGNNAVNAMESAKISFELENIGNGKAEGIQIKTTLINRVNGLELPGIQKIGDLEPGENKIIELSLKASKQLQEGYAELKIEALEKNAFDAFPLFFNLQTEKFREPHLKVIDAAFSTDDGGTVKLNYPVNLRLLIQNIGPGISKESKATINLPHGEPIYANEQSTFMLGDIKPNDNRIVDFIFTVTKRFEGKSVPIRINLDELFSEYASDTLIKLNLSEDLFSKNEIEIRKLMPMITDDSPSPISLMADVDVQIPKSENKFQDKFALVIGNEEYSKYQATIDDEINVNYARNDARIFSQYLINTLGFKKSNVYLLLDATKGEIQQKIDLVAKRCAKASGETELVFYYAGHGLPHEVTRDPYIIPTDVSGANVENGLKLSSDIYKELGKSGADRILVFLDACFTGSGRNDILLAARSVAIKPDETLLAQNMVVLSASSGTQASLPYDQKYHGMFTYYLLKTLQESKGKVSLGELFEKVSNKVSQESLRINEKEQDPEVQSSKNIGSTWTDWKLR